MFITRLFLLLALLPLFSAFGAKPAHAQRTIFDFFEERIAPNDWEAEQEYRRRMLQRQRARERNEVSDASPKWNEVTKNSAAKTVLVLGDEYAEGLAQGLREAFASDPMAIVRPGIRQNSGLVKNDQADWLQLGRDMAIADKPVAIVVMLGLNDRVPFMEGTQKIEFRSPRWEILYGIKVDAFLNMLRDRGVPVYIVGMPISRNRAMSGDIAYINDVFRQKAAGASVKFVDVWEGFVDEDASYIAIGPDVNGNTRRLRKADGVGLSPAGNRKLAFYAEKELRRDVAFGTPNTDVPQAGDNAPQNNTGPGDPVLSMTYVGPVLPLSNKEAPKDIALMGAVAETLNTQTDLSRQVLLEGQASTAKPGRLDDFTWPPESKQALPIFKPGAPANTPRR